MRVRRFVCGGCGHVWYSAANADRPCEACGGRLAEEAGDDDGRARWRAELQGGFAAVAVGGGGAAAAQPGGEKDVRPGGGGPVPPRVPREAVCRVLGGG